MGYNAEAKIVYGVQVDTSIYHDDYDLLFGLSLENDNISYYYSESGDYLVIYLQNKDLYSIWEVIEVDLPEVTEEDKNILNEFLKALGVEDKPKWLLYSDYC